MEVYGLLASGYGDWPIIKQIAWLLGQVMNGIFNVLSKIGIENIGVCIIILLTGHKNLRFDNILEKAVFRAHRGTPRTLPAVPVKACPSKKSWGRNCREK